MKIYTKIRLRKEVESQLQKTSVIDDDGAKLWRRTRRKTRTAVRQAAPKIASAAVITLLIASIFPLALFTITPSVIPKAAATGVLFQDDFESGNLNNWADFGSTYTPPSNTQITTVDKWNGIYSMYSNNTGSTPDFTLMAPYAAASNFSVTYKIKIVNETFPSMFWNEIISYTSWDNHVLIMTTDYDNFTNNKIALRVGASAYSEVTNTSNIRVNDIVGKWQDFKVDIYNYSTGVKAVLFINGSNVAQVTDNHSFNESLTQLEFGYLNGYLDSVMVYTPPTSPSISPNIIFRNDFEPVQNYTNWDWKNAVNGTISNDYTYYTNGTRSFKFVSDSSKHASYGYVQASTNFTQITDTMWAKMDVRINPYPSSTYSKIRVFELLNSNTNIIAAISLYKGGNDKEKIELKSTYPTTQWNYSGNLNLQPNQWYTIEFKFYKHSTQGEYRVYINGMEVITLTDLDTHSAVPAKIRVGAPYTDLTYSSWTAWLDNVTVSKDYRIGPTYTGPVFKDGFEKGLYENWDWSSISGGSFSNDTYVKVEGSQSLNFTANSTTSYGYYTASENFTNLNDDFWMQMHVRIDKYPYDAYDKVEFFELRNSSGPIAGLRFYMGSDGKEMIELKRYLPAVTYNYSTPLGIKNDTWQKIEFRLFRSASGGVYSVYLNESEIITIDNVDTSSSATEPASIKVGAIYADNSYDDWNIWVDNVTVSDWRVTRLTGPQDCGDERVGNPPYGYTYFYNKGTDQSTDDKYGIRAESEITNPYICGTDQTDGSVAGSQIWVFDIDGAFIEVGWYKGIYQNYSLSALDLPHYYRGYYLTPGITNRHYKDYSRDLRIYPVVGDTSNTHWANFSLYGDTSPYPVSWTIKIESKDKSGSAYTITDSQYLGANYGEVPGAVAQVVLEFHNSNSSATAHFKNIQSAVNIDGVLTWQDWDNSTEDYNSHTPYVSYRMYQNEYCMYTKPQRGCP